MTMTQIKRLLDKYRSLFLGLLLLCFYFSGSGQTYNPSTCCTVSNKAYGAAQAVSTDGRSWFYDATNFVMRDYNGTTEVLSYLNLAKYRSGHFPVFVHSGGILQSNGVWVGGSTLVYWFKDSTGNANLVRWYTDSTGVPGGPFYAVANNLSEGNAGLIKGNLALDLVNNTSDATKNAATVSLTNHTIDANNNTLLHISNSALTNNTIGLTLNNTGATPQVTTTPAALGTSLVLAVPWANASDSGFLRGSDWSEFDNKLDSVHISNDSVYNCVNGTCTLQSVLAGGGAVNSVNGTNTSLLFSPSTGNVLGQVNPAFAFNWTGQHTFTSFAPIFSTLTTNGGVFYGNGTGQLLQTGVGTSGQIFQSNGGTAPTFFTPNATTLDGWLGYTPLSNALGSSHIFVGNGSNIATDVAMSGGATISNTGAVTLNAAGSNTQAQINNGGLFGTVPNFTANSSSHVVNADSMTTQRLQTNSALINKVPWVVPTSLNVLGNSFDANLRPCTPDTSYRDRIATFWGLSLNIYAASSSGTAYSVGQANTNFNGNLASATFCGTIAFNDFRSMGYPNYGGFRMAMGGYNAVWFAHFLKSFALAGTGTGVTRVGTWTTTVNTGAWKGKAGTSGASTTNNGDYITYVNPAADSSIGVSLIGLFTGGATFDAYLDGALQGHYTENRMTSGVTDGVGYDDLHVPFVLMWTGLPLGVHILKLVNTSSVPFYVDYFGQLRDAATATPLILLKSTYNDSAANASTGTGAVNGVSALKKLNDLIDSLSVTWNQHYPWYLVPSVMDTLSGICQTDQIHPNNYGDSLQAAKILSILPSLTTPQTFGSVYQGSRHIEATRFGAKEYLPEWGDVLKKGDGNKFIQNSILQQTGEMHLQGVMQLQEGNQGLGKFITDIDGKGTMGWISTPSGIPGGAVNSVQYQLNSTTFGGFGKWNNTNGWLAIGANPATPFVDLSVTHNYSGFAVVTLDNNDPTGQGGLRLTNDLGGAFYLRLRGSSSGGTYGSWILGSGAIYNNINTDMGIMNDVSHDIWFATGSGAPAPEVMRLSNSGSMKLNKYGIGTYTGTATRSLNVDASGNVIERVVAGPVASNDLTGQTAGATVTSFSVPGSGSFNTFSVGGYVTITAVALDVVQMQITWTDETNTSRTQVFYPMGSTTPGLSATGSNPYPTATIRAKQGTTITIATVLTTGTGSITYDAGGTITQMN